MPAYRSGSIIQNPTPQPIGGMLKRLTDIVLAFAAIVLLSPVMVFIAALIKMSDRGPAIYAQRRIGFNGREFRCYKFRSMVMNSSEILAQLLESDPAAAREWRETQKLKNDPRVTSIGYFLRVTSLDELPQLFNVLAGDMSFVGPRPIVEAEKDRYGENFSNYALVRPGITGPWQVGGRSDTTYAQRVRLDVEYVENWSIAQDVRILLKTFGVVVQRRGSY